MRIILDKAALKKKWKRFWRQTNPARICVAILFFLWCGSFLYSMGWAVMSSLNDHVDMMVDPMALPKKLNFKNYLEAFKILETADTSFMKMIFNTLWLTLGSTFVSIACVVMTAYSLGNFKYKGRNGLVAGMIICMMVPLYGSGSSTLILYHKLGMYDSPLILLASASGIGNLTLIVMTFFQTLSPAYGEAAKMDGAGYWRIFLEIHVPMVLPALSSVVLLMLIGGWNDAMTSIYYLPSYPTIAAGLYKYETTSKFNMNKPVYFAGVIMCAIPPIILFAAFRDKLMTNVTIGGIK